MYILRSFYQVADGEYISTKSNPMSREEAEFLQDRMYFHFYHLSVEGKVNSYSFTVEEVCMK